MDNKQLWQNVLSEISNELNPMSFNTWFTAIDFIDIKDDSIRLVVPIPFYKEHIDENYRVLIINSFNKFLTKNVDNIKYILQADLKDTLSEVSASPDSADIIKKEEKTFESNLRSVYTFDSFVVGESNKFAQAAALAVAENPGTMYNPLFIYGNSGLGKTHLMHAIGNYIVDKHKLRVLYVTCDNFMNDFMGLARVNNQGNNLNYIEFFKNKYRNIDVLIIDDIQDLIGKERTQNTFFHIFNHLQLNGKQIIISSDCPQSQMKGMSERMLTRFKWGMTVKLERPDFELRKEVLTMKAQNDGLSINEEVLDYIASNVTDSIRELEGVMVSLVAHATILNVDITIDLARSVIQNSFKMTQKQVNFEMITQEVSNYYGIDADDIYTKSRKREISDARQMVMYLAKKHAKMPLTAIGTRLSRTHATVLYACKNIEDRLPHEKQLKDDVTKIESKIFA